MDQLFIEIRLKHNFRFHFHFYKAALYLAIF